MVDTDKIRKFWEWPGGEKVHNLAFQVAYDAWFLAIKPLLDRVTELENELEDAKFDYEVLSSDYKDLQEDLYRAESSAEEAWGLVDETQECLALAATDR